MAERAPLGSGSALFKAECISKDEFAKRGSAPFGGQQQPRAELSQSI